MIDKKIILERFCKYVKINTQSDPDSSITPSTKEQLIFGRLLVDELVSIGLMDAVISDKGYVTASLSANCSDSISVVGFIAHMDTSPDMTGENVKPQVIENYNGEKIVLNHDQGIILDPREFPELLNYTGCDIVTTDGTTLLGADDKAGITEIITAIEYLLQHPEIEHGRIKICFTPDEEIGQGADFFDVKAFGADFAYTMDGGEIGELEYENFNAAKVNVIIKGRNIHPGYAKDKMVNAVLLANRFIQLLPCSEVPEKTSGYEGFYHVNSIKGTVEEASIDIIIRDFDFNSFQHRKQKVLAIQQQINTELGHDAVMLEVTDQYYNMHEKIANQMHVIDLAKRAMVLSGVEPKIKPIRGGTDGARLSFMGLPTPNIFAGGHNFHGRYEFVPLQSMQKAAEVIVNIVSLLKEC